MSTGELFLTANQSNTENIALVDEPELTFFKTVYYNYTNFSVENIFLNFSTPDPDFGRKMTVNISKNAEMLGNVYLYVELPTISETTNSTLPDGIRKFAWIKKVGLGIIKNIDLEVNGIRISRITGDYLNMIYNRTVSDGHVDSFNEMIGNLSDLYDYSTSKDSYKLMIPLDFWFCKDSQYYLPLVALKHSEIKIHVEFNSFNKCYKESPTNYIVIQDRFSLFIEGEILSQTVNNSTVLAEYVYYDSEKQRLYYNKISGDFKIPPNDNLVSTYKITGLDSSYEVLLNTTSEVISDKSFFISYPPIKESYIMADYVYLDTLEKVLLESNQLKYVIPLVENLQEKIITNTQGIYSIDTLVNPTKMLLWRCQMLYNSEANNTFDYSTYPYNLTSDPIVNNCQLVINSLAREQLTFEKFYSNLQFYTNKLNYRNVGEYMYSFSIYPREQDPSGSFNFSRADNTSYIKFSFNSIVSTDNPVSVRLYSIYYGIFTIIDGVGNLEFYS